MIDTTLENTLNAARLINTVRHEGAIALRSGMAWLFEDRPVGKCLGLFTHSFAERFCDENPGYVWREA